MFTGIIEELGEVTGTAPGQLKIKTAFADVKKGDSIAVNGICLTAKSITRAGKDRSEIVFDASPETISRSNLNVLKSGVKVNLERAMSAQSRFGGHIMTGHVEQTGKLLKVTKSGNSLMASFSAPSAVMKYAVPKGSIGVDGISLTIAVVEPASFTVAVIPHTFENTNLKFRKKGDTVNLEPDILAKYVENAVAHGKPGRITREFLKEHGF